MRFNYIRNLLVCVLAFWTMKCGNAGKSSDVHLSVSPSSPVVISTPFQLSQDVTIAAPWFAFVMTVTNSSDTTMTIINLSLHVTVWKPDGTIVAGDVTIDPSAADWTETCSSTVTQQINYTDLGEYAPGESSTIKLDYRGSLQSGCSQPSTLHPTLYAGGLPSVQVNGNNFYSYTIEVTPNGWFGTVNAPTERLNVHYYFTAN